MSLSQIFQAMFIFIITMVGWLVLGWIFVDSFDVLFSCFYVDAVAANNPPVQPSLNDSAALNSSFQCPHCHSLCTAESQVDQRYVKELETELHKAETELHKAEAKIRKTEAYGKWSTYYVVLLLGSAIALLSIAVTFTK